MSTVILLIRHAAHVELGRILSGRRADVMVSSTGLTQMRGLAQRLSREPLAAVYSSPCARARDTANAIAEPHGLGVRLETGLDEIDFGEWQGKSFASLDRIAAWQKWNEARGSARAPGGESMVEAVDRAEFALAKIAASHPGETVAAVTHCDIIRGLVAQYLGLPLDNILRFDIDPASLSGIAFDSGGVRISAVNERVLS